MTVIQSGNPLSYLGVKAPFPPNILALSQAPDTTTQANIGDIGIVVGSASYECIDNTNGFTWVQLGGTSGAITSVNGTANQITATTVGNAVTLSLPAAITAPGSLTTTTSLTSTTTITAGTGLTVTTGGALVSAGNIIATNGNLSLGTAGNKIVIATGTNASVGTSGVMSGTPGAVTVSTNASSATAKIFYCRNVTGGTPGQVSITAQDGTGFTLTSTGNETSTFNWWIINA